jgi:hypothetical protein
MYRNDTLLFRRRYQLRSRDFGHGERLVIEYEGGGEKFVRLVGDTLVLTDSCTDCYTSAYVRSS